MRTAQRRRLAMGSFFVGVCMLVMLTTQSTDARITREDIRRAHLAVRERGGTSRSVADLRCEGLPLPTAPEGAVKFFALGDWVFEAWMWDQKHNSTSLAGFRAPLERTNQDSSSRLETTSIRRASPQKTTDSSPSNSRRCTVMTRCRFRGFQVWGITIISGM